MLASKYLGVKHFDKAKICLKKECDLYMDFDYKKEFYNLKYGKCYLIDEKENLYLIYADKCFNHYIVCTYIEPNSNAMINQEFFPTLEYARKYFNEK